MRIKRGKICSICKENIAVVQISDSMVCEDCMPAEYTDNPLNISSRKIRFMLHDDPEYERSSGKEINKIHKVPDPFLSRLLAHDWEYSLSDEINTQLQTAERVDIAVSFIYTSGLSLIYDSLRKVSETSPIRVITTAYTGSSEPEALHDLAMMSNCSLKMELNVGSRRLHMKNYIFHRSGGYSTALVGSANLSRVGLTTGAECVIRISEADLPDIFSDVKADFDKIWMNPAYRPISQKNRPEIEDALYNNKIDYEEY